jgi:photosystem II stability/assembly factor-like uncharacterized protein
MAAWACLAVAAGVPGSAAAGEGFKDPLTTPAPANTRLTETQMTAATLAGDRVIAVGARGVIAYSDDHGETWTQATVPVSIDLLAVTFSSPTMGWAVGHGGVVLHSADGGQTWVKQFDGLQARDILTSYFQRKVVEGAPDAQRYLDDVKFSYSGGPEQALLDVLFLNDKTGYVVGSFGTFFATHDGGATWEPLVDRVASSYAVHLNDIESIGGTLFIASEMGVVYRLNRDTGLFEPLKTGYGGSFFTMTGRGDFLMAFGLRGSAYRSLDGGDTWEATGTELSSAFANAFMLPDGSVLAVALAGQAFRFEDQGATVISVTLQRPMLLAGGTATGDGAAVLVGLNGIQKLTLGPG